MARIFLSLRLGLQLLAVQLPLAAALDNGVANTPPLGWCSWQRYRCAIGCNDATSFRASVAAAEARWGVVAFSSSKSRLVTPHVRGAAFDMAPLLFYVYQGPSASTKG